MPEAVSLEETELRINPRKAPFPWFGGKSQAAPVIWEALGDVAHYVEPFAGSLANLLNRPHPCNRAYFSETVNDADGLLVNAWRAIQQCPEETAAAASWPVSELDKTARGIALLKWREDKMTDLLAGSPEWCDPKMAGWWLWCVCCQIGAWGIGSWTADEAGRVVKIDRKAERREPGVTRDRPHLSDNGMGVNHPGTREPGVLDAESEFHPLTMPQLIRWFQWLAARLRHVRILHGDWARLVTSGSAKTLPVRQKQGVCGILLDPPYADSANRADGLYAQEDLTVAHAVKTWCLAHGDDPDYRIVLCGFAGEHDDALVNAGWREVEWFKAGFLRGGMAQQSKNGHQQARERLWMSPHCLQPAAPPDQETLNFADFNEEMLTQEVE